MITKAYNELPTANYTPGPWKVEFDGQIVGPRTGCSCPIITKMAAWWPDKRNQGHVSQDLQEANARLIALAPEMLGALKFVLSRLAPEGTQRTHWRCDARIRSWGSRGYNRMARA